MKLRIVNLMLAVFVFAGCNTSSNSSNGTPPSDNPGDNDIKELGYDPKVRWPDQGEYSYNHRYSYNGSACETGEQKFGNLAEYCMALQDQKRNSGCALPSRKSTYKNQCGDDFQELNFKGEFYRTGFDSHIQEQCSTDRSVSEFRNLNHYCNFLKDETLHKNCFWTDRNKHFRNKACGGDFSPMPGAVSGPIDQKPPVDPEPQPNPNPTPNPQPLPDPVQGIPIVKELKEHGITTTVDWQSIRTVSSQPMPGEPSVQEKMKVLWAELAENKNELIKRKATLKEIEISIFTNFYNGGQQFFIDFETRQNHLKDYFPLSDKILAYENELKIKFDLIHSGSYSETTSYRPLRQMIALIEKYFADLKASSGLFKEIKADSYAAYFSKSQALTIRRDFLESDFAKYLNLLKPLAPTMNWFKSKAVELEADFDIDESSREVYDAFKVIESTLPSFEQLVNAGMLKEVSLYFHNGDQNYFSSLKSLSLSIDFTNKRVVTDTIIKLGRVALLAREGQVEITVSGSKLTDGFIKTVGYLEKFWPKIKTKLSFIKEIELGYESKFYSGLKQLNIGYNSTESETEKVINEIK